MKKSLQPASFEDDDTNNMLSADNENPKTTVIAKNVKGLHIGDVYNINLPVKSVTNEEKVQLKEKSDSLHSYVTGHDKEMFQMSREILMNCYKTRNAYMKSLLWNERNNDFPIKEYFVDLRVQKAELLGMRTGQTADFKEIFRQIHHKHLTMLVSGEPGYGKTTLCKKIAYDWGADEKRTDYLGHFDFVVFIVLRELGSKTVSDAVLHSISKNSDTEIEIKLRRAGYNFLVILDGFDEVNNTIPVIEFLRSDSFRISQQMMILITSRPHVAEHIREEVDLRFSLEGFSPEQKEKYVNLLIKEDERRKEQLLNLIKFSDFHSALTVCPLMLHMLCCLPHTKYLKKIKTTTDLFIQIFHLIIKRYRRKQGENCNLKKGRYFYGEDVLIKLGKLYFEKGLVATETYIKTKNYKIFKEARVTNKDLKKRFAEEEEQFILGLDILAKCFEENSVIYFEFLHNSLMEFVITLHFWNSFETTEDCYIRRRFDLLFLFGLYGEEQFPQSFLNLIKQQIYYPKVWLELYNEIKNEFNRQMFCSNSKVVFDRYCLSEIKNLKKLSFPCNELYFCLSDSKYFYEEIRKKLIEFHKDYNSSNKTEIYIIIDRSATVSPLIQSDDNYQFDDIREPVATIQNLINSFKWDKFNIYLYRVLPYRNFEPTLLPEELIDIFINVENPAAIPKEIKKKLNKAKKNLVALHGEIKDNERVKYLLSSEQFSYLEPHIKILSPREEKRCAIKLILNVK